MAFRTQVIWAGTWLPLMPVNPSLASSCRWVARSIVVDPELPIGCVTIGRAGSQTVKQHFLRRAGGGRRPDQAMREIEALGAQARGISARDVVPGGTGKIEVLFTVVRHPIDRLASAYRLISSNPAMRGAAPAEALESFEDFANFVPGARQDQHWRPQSSLLEWALPGLSFVARLETLAKDLNAGFATTPYASWIEGLDKARLNRSSATRRPMDLSKRSLDLLCDYYAEDFRLFGYSPSSLMTTGQTAA